MPDERRPGRHLEDYIGDAVYVYMDDAAQVVLYTSNGIVETNRVVLEPQVLMSFQRWLERRGEYITAFQSRRSDGRCVKNLACIFAADHEDECGFMAP